MAAYRKRAIRTEGDIALVPLTRGLEAVIDAADAPLVSNINWQAHPNAHTAYARSSVLVGGKKSCIHMHRLILSAPAGVEVDHINGDGLDNRRSNIRLCTHRENMQNQRRRATNTTGLKGVCRKPHLLSKQWVARITVKGRRISLGYFATAEEAAAAYHAAASQLHGQFSRTA